MSDDNDTDDTLVGTTSLSRPALTTLAPERTCIACFKQSREMIFHPYLFRASDGSHYLRQVYFCVSCYEQRK